MYNRKVFRGFDVALDTDKVRKLAKQRGWRVKDLATAAGMLPGNLSRILCRDGSGIGVDLIDDIAEALEVHPRKLICRPRHDPRIRRVTPSAPPAPAACPS